VSAADTPLSDVLAEARRLVDAAADGGLTMRVLGGAGVALHDHGPVPDGLLRIYGDIDIVVPAKANRSTATTLMTLGYQPNERFNALHGARRMLFYDSGNGRQLDVFVGIFAMCHSLDLGRRLGRHAQALGAADLLLTKLQIAQINRKDVVDAARILLTHDLADADSDDDALSLGRLRDVTSGDWGWFTTFTDNLATVRTAAPDLLEPGLAGQVVWRVDRVRTALDEAPKSMRWRARSVIGRKSPWYELPEEVDREAAR
jgi:Uncharacterised nucleotidyltransferase